FEEPARRQIRCLLATGGNAVFAPAQAEAIGLWFLKTWLLLAHPDATSPEPDIEFPRWRSVSADLWTWVVKGQSPPPEGLSLWVTKRSNSRLTHRPTMRIPLPVVVADGEEIEFQVQHAGLGWPGSRSQAGGLDVSLVYHPFWEIKHPLEQEGRAFRLWPRNQ